MPEENLTYVLKLYLTEGTAIYLFRFSLKERNVGRTRASENLSSPGFLTFLHCKITATSTEYVIIPLRSIFIEATPPSGQSNHSWLCAGITILYWRPISAFVMQPGYLGSRTPPLVTQPASVRQYRPLYEDGEPNSTKWARRGWSMGMLYFGETVRHAAKLCAWHRRPFHLEED